MSSPQPTMIQQTPMSLPWQPRANLGAVSHYNPQQWLLDSGATHHLTSDLNNLALHQPYNGGEAVSIADGSGLQITHTGSASIRTPSKTLLLNDVLCVPHVNKNLLSVYRLCNANQVCVAFFPSYFQVMDLKGSSCFKAKRGVNCMSGRCLQPRNLFPMLLIQTPKPPFPNGIHA